MYKKDKSFLSYIKHLTIQSETNAVTKNKEILATVDNLLLKHINRLQNVFLENCVAKIELVAEISQREVVVGKFIDSSMPITISAFNENELKSVIDNLSLEDIVSYDKDHTRPIKLDYRGYSQILYNNKLLPTINSLLELIKNDPKLKDFRLQLANYMNDNGKFGKSIIISWVEM